MIFLEQDLTLTLRRQVQREIKTNTRETKETIRPLWRQNHTLGIMYAHCCLHRTILAMTYTHKSHYSMTILSGMLAFDIMDHVMGDWTVLNEQWFEDLGEKILGTTTLWFWMNIVCGHSQQRHRTAAASRTGSLSHQRDC